ncbi:hypothetical protein NL676_031467 [Syzygium grande]|nr:hypothetical protein NL676_031467 [Syzygium grande]
MLVSSNSFSDHLNKLSEAAKDLQKSVEASLKRAPPSKSNPTQNRFLVRLTSKEDGQTGPQREPGASQVSKSRYFQGQGLGRFIFSPA